MFPLFGNLSSPAPRPASEIVTGEELNKFIEFIESVTQIIDLQNYFTVWLLSVPTMIINKYAFAKLTEQPFTFNAIWIIDVASLALYVL